MLLKMQHREPQTKVAGGDPLKRKPYKGGGKGGAAAAIRFTLKGVPPRNLGLRFAILYF